MSFFHRDRTAPGSENNNRNSVGFSLLLIPAASGCIAKVRFIYFYILLFHCNGMYAMVFEKKLEERDFKIKGKIGEVKREETKRNVLCSCILLSLSMRMRVYIYQVFSSLVSFLFSLFSSMMPLGMV
ncbi:hypothetical protein RYX36_029847 [Vicia faba]